MVDQPTSVESAPNAGATPEYGAFYYRHDCGIPYERNEHWLAFFAAAADGIVRNLHPTSVLDAGCAMGFLVEALHRRGVDAYGIDISEYAIAKVDNSVADRCRVGSIAEPFDRRYDLITCVEVLEHIPPHEADQVIANLCRSTDRILLSTSPSDYGEATHLNVQPPEAWSAALAREGFLRNLDLDFSYLTPWTSLYTRVEEPLAETVRRYDRSWSRLRLEVAEVRAALLSSQEDQARREEEESLERRPQVLAEMDRLNEENLKLRDLLVGRDAELGVVRGRLAAAEDQAQRLTNTAARIQSRIPGAGFAMVALRKLRRG
jgi:SAM-dependent methyltransferase